MNTAKERIMEISAKLMTELKGAEDFNEKLLPRIEAMSEAVFGDPQLASVTQQFGVSKAIFQNMYVFLLRAWAEDGFPQQGMSGLIALLSEPGALGVFFSVVFDLAEKTSPGKKASLSDVLGRAAPAVYREMKNRQPSLAQIEAIARLNDPTDPKQAIATLVVQLRDAIESSPKFTLQTTKVKLNALTSQVLSMPELAKVCGDFRVGHDQLNTYMYQLLKNWAKDDFRAEGSIAIVATISNGSRLSELLRAFADAGRASNGWFATRTADELIIAAAEKEYARISRSLK